MLVLTRTIGEGIMIGDEIEVVVLSSQGGKVRLGIHAPSAIAVHRKEIYLAIQAQGELGAAGASPGEGQTSILDESSSPPRR